MTVSVSAVGQPLWVSIGTTPEHCGHQDGTATAIAYGGTGSYSYLWNTVPTQTSNMATGLSMGVYTVTVYDGQDTSTVSDTVRDSSPICWICNIQNDTNGLNQGEICICVSGGTGTYTYWWSIGVNLPCLTGLPAGNYTGNVSDGYCFCSDSGIIENASSITEMSMKDFVSIFPNPTNGIFTLEISNYDNSDFSIELVDIFGRIVYIKKLTDKTMTFDISKQPQGFYYLKVYNRQMILNKKILKE